MLLRNHPLMSYQGIPSWLPVWTFSSGVEKEHPRRGEMGILKAVMESKVEPTDRCFLHIDYKGSFYVGCLLIDDKGFCSQIVTLLRGNLKRPIAEIGSLDLSYTL